MRSLLTDPAYSALGSGEQARRRLLLTGGLVIRTTIDLAAETAAAEAVSDSVPQTDPSGLGAAAVTVEPGTGRVVAMAQNRTYDVTAQRGRTSVNWSTDADLGGASGFQTGSSFKPFTLATWLADGHSLGESVNAMERAFPYSEFTACGSRLRGSTPYAPGNSEGHEGGRISVRQATADSVNVAYVEMESQLDLCDIAKTAEGMGVHLASPEKDECGGSGRTTQLPTCLPSLTLGVKNIAPLTMAAAYATFASGGVYCTPLPVTSVARINSDGHEGDALVTVTPSCRRVLDPDVASGVNEALTGVLTNGTAAGTGMPGRWPAAGKTGTTDGPYDSWFVGYTAQRSTAVWVADPGQADGSSYRRTQLTGITVAGRRYPIIFGATLAAPIWKQAMLSAMEGLPVEDLP